MGKDEVLKKDRDDGANQERKVKKRLWQMLVILCIVVFSFSVFSVFRILMESSREKNTFDDLIAMVEAEVEPLEKTVSGNGEIADKGTERDFHKAEDNSQKNETEKGPRRNYGFLKEKNPDFAGWIQIPDTKLDYPVMHTPKDMQYYIRRDFYGKDSVSGTPFIGDFCNTDSMSMIVYGHNMKNGTMFGELDLYEKQKYRDEHPMLQFDTLEESREYEIFAAFRTKLDTAKGAGDGFHYYEYVGDLTRERFEEFMNYLKGYSYYDTGSWPEYGDQLMILSTCSYHTEEGRFVVVARRVK